MVTKQFAELWKSLGDADQRWFVDHVGEHLEKVSGVKSDAGVLGEASGIDSRALIDAFDHAANLVIEGK